MDSIFRAFSAHRTNLLHLENVVGVGVGHKSVGGLKTGRKAIVVLVRQKVPLAEIPSSHAIPKTLSGHATDVIEVGDIVLLTRTGRLRPALPGSSIGHFAVSAGTFGCVVLDNKTNERLILSNNHVLANMTDGRDGRAREGDDIYQPGRYDNATTDDLIGHLLRWVPIYRDVMRPDCTVAKAVEEVGNAIIRMVKPAYQMRLVKKLNRENLVDAAIARPLSPELISDEIIDIGVPKGVVDPIIGMAVQKSGRTSGYTTGSIVVIGASIKVAMGDIGFATFVDQIVTTPMGEPGDSGSLILDDQSRAVGLLAAGSDKATVGGNIKNVLQSLNVRLLTK